MITHLFFDLDGTLTDSCVGITRCIEHALREAGREPPPAADLVKYVGPPLTVAFAELLRTSDPEAIERAIAAYRVRFEPIGMYENAVFPGIERALARFAARGMDLSVVTAKPAVYASRILEHFGLRSRFGDVFGPALGVREYSKATLLDGALRSRSVEPASAAMVGDRAEDIVAAHENGVHSIAVTWGYGTRAELEAARPDRLVESPAALVASLETWPEPS